MPRNYISALDVGTSKACSIVGEPTETGIDVWGIGIAPSTGLRRGTVINIASTMGAIRDAVHDAELMSGHDITQVWCSISGTHVRCKNSRGMVAIKNKEVTAGDVHRVIEASRTTPLREGSRIIHILAREFIVDDNDGVKKPIGMAGVKLEAEVHIVTAAQSAIDNLTTCCSREGIKVQQMVLSSLAASEAALRPDEKELGVALLDIGAGTSDLIVWFDDAVVHTAVLPVGGALISKDIAVGFRTPRGEAEKLKIQYGSAMASLVDEDEAIEVPGVAGRKPQTKSRRFLAEIIEPRMEEIFTLAAQEIQRSGYEEHIAAGIVLTGGTANLPGITELGEQLLDTPVRVGKIRSDKVSGIQTALESPEHAVAVGLLLIAAQSKYDEDVLSTSKRKTRIGIFSRFKDWVKRSYVEA